MSNQLSRLAACLTALAAPLMAFDPPSVVPEPGTLLLVVGGLAGALLLAKKRRRG